MLVAAFGCFTGDCCTNFTANSALLRLKLFMLLIKVYYLSVINIEHFIGPESAACVDIGIQFEWNKSTCDTKFSFLLAKNAS